MEKERLKHSVCNVLRTRWELTQFQLSDAAGVGQCDISEIENYPPYGKIDKFERLARFFGVPIDAIILNDFSLLGDTKLNCPKLHFSEMPTEEMKIIGRLGEELALSQEEVRLSEQYPALVELVMPYFKMKGLSPGYDIFSFDEWAQPVHIEVKTSLPGSTGFRLSSHEMKTAKKLLREGKRYVVRNISNWGTPDQSITDIQFEDILHNYNVKEQCFFCTPKTSKNTTISGLAYFRELRGMTQQEFAEIMGTTQSRCSLRETGECRPAVEYYIKASKALDASIEELLATYQQATIIE